MKRLAILASLSAFLLIFFYKAYAVSVLALGPTDVPGTGCPWAIGYDPSNITNAEKEATNRYIPSPYAQNPNEPIFLFKAPPGTGYGAIALGLTARNTCRYGYIFNQQNQDVATQLALTACRAANEEMSIPCSIATVWYY